LSTIKKTGRSWLWTSLRENSTNTVAVVRTGVTMNRSCPLAETAEIQFEIIPGTQAQADRADLGLWPLGERLVQPYGVVAILGYSREPAFRFATDVTHRTTLDKLVWCLHDLGGVPFETPIDRDSAL